MSGSGQVLVAELERDLDCHVGGRIHSRAGDYDSLGDSVYNNAIDLTTVYHLFNVLFQHYTIVLAASRTPITLMPIDEVKHSVK